MLRMEIVYDPTNHAEPLKIVCPSDVNPSLVTLLLSQIITAFSFSQVAGKHNGLIIPATNLPKVNS